jgi:glycerol kinase
MKRFILALDQGTSSSRALVFDHSGATVAVAQAEFTQHFPQSGWVEHDPEEIWSSQRSVALEAMRKAKIKAADLAAIGLTNQRETTLLWDRKTGEPVHRAIVWQDRRTAGLCDALREAHGDDFFRQKTGLVVDPYFSATKIGWMLDHVPGLRARAERGEIAFGTVDSWLIWKLTGGRLHVTDATNAARTLLFNIRSGAWDEELLQVLQIPHALLPEVRPSSGHIGEVSAVPELEGVPLAGMAGDQHAALFGQACYEPGMAKNTYGTGCFVLMNTGDQPVFSQNGLVTTVAWKIGEKTEYALEGSIFVAGALIQWLRDSLGIIRTAAEVEALASSVQDTGGVTVIPAFSGLGAPHWDAYARAAVLGLTRGSGPAHIARAALEAIAWQVVDVLDAMKNDAAVSLPELRVDGGASANNLLMQIQADLLQAPVSRPRTTETTALGAAFLAGLAVGFWRDRAEIAAQWALNRRFEPGTASEQVALSRRRWLEGVTRAKGWARLDEPLSARGETPPA